MPCASPRGRHAVQPLQEALLASTTDQLHAEHARGRSSRTLLGLALAQQAVVDEDAGELVAHGPVNQRRRHRRVDAARQAAEHPPVAHLGADGLRLLSATNEPGVQSPAQPQMLVQEIGQDLGALRRVDDLGMELDAGIAALVSPMAAMGELALVRQDVEAGRQPRDAVAVAHPHRQAARQPGEERIGGVCHLDRRRARTRAGPTATPCRPARGP